MTWSEILAFLFLFNATAAAGEYAGPAVVRAGGELVKSVFAGKDEPDADLPAGDLPRGEDADGRMGSLKQSIATSDQYDTISSLDRAEFKRLIVRCLRNHFTADDMGYALKTDARIVGYLELVPGDPRVVADKLYELACLEDKVHWLVDAMLRFEGREQAVRDCLLSED